MTRSSLTLEPPPSYILAEVSLEKDFTVIRIQAASTRWGRLPDLHFFPVGGKNNWEKFGEHFTQSVYLAIARRESIQESEGSTELSVSYRAEEAGSEQL